jgi:hypothetical protein
MAQQCQPSTSVTGQSATGEGATVDMAKSGPTVMAAAGGRKQRSSRLQAHVPSWDSERTLSHGVKTTRPCSVPRTARACTTAAPRTTRPVALTLRHGRCRRFDPGGSLDRRVNYRRVSQPRWVGARRSTKGGKQQRGNPRPSCCPAPRSGALAVGGYKRPRGRVSERERERESLCGGPFSRAANLLVREPWTFLL